MAQHECRPVESAERYRVFVPDQRPGSSPEVWIGDVCDVRAKQASSLNKHGGHYPVPHATSLARMLMSSIAKLIALTDKDKVAGDEEIAATGYDIRHALESCRQKPGVKNQWTYNPFPALAHHASGTVPVQSEKLQDAQDGTKGVAGPPEGKDSNETWMFDPVTTPYSKWNTNALAIFQELSTAVVAGMLHHQRACTRGTAHRAEVRHGCVDGSTEVSEPGQRTATMHACGQELRQGELHPPTEP